MPLTYALISALILCCGYLCYRWIMADERQHGYNRALLYVTYAVALMAPFFLLTGSTPSAPASGDMIVIGDLKALSYAYVGEAQSSESTMLSAIARILVIAYLIGVAIMAAVSLFGLMQLLRVIRKGEKIPAGKYILVITENKRLAPFSWMSYIVMNAADYAESGEVILEHERCHLRLRHWVDLMFAQMVICLQWFNPAAWLMRDELRNVHEYQADEAVMKSGADIAGYQKMLIKKAVGSRFQSFANSLNHSKLKKRVTMMYKEKSSAVRRMSALLLAPALAAGCFVTAVPAVARVLDSFAEVNFASDSENKVTKISSTQEIKIPETVTTVTEESMAEPEVAAMPTETAVAAKENNVPEDVIEAQAASEEKRKREVHKTADSIAEFPGGMSAMMEYLRNNIKYPEEAMKNDEEGLVVVGFVVEADGSVTEVEVKKGETESLDKEAIRVVRSMPKWKPGMLDGKPVATWYSLPVKFSLKSTKESEKR